MKTIYVLLIGNKESGEINHFQLLQEEVALSEGKRAGFSVEVGFAPGFDQLRVLKKRLMEGGSATIDAVVTEPASVAAMDLMLRELKGKVGLVLLNMWSPAVEEYASGWGSEHPFGTVSTDHSKIGETQSKQISGLLPKGGNVLILTGPQRSTAAQQRLTGLKTALGANLRLYEGEAGQWSEVGGMNGFNGWYSVFKARNEEIQVVAAQSDELAVGAQKAAQALKNVAHRDMFLKAKYLGVDADSRYGRALVDSGKLAASIITPANTGIAISGLEAFWKNRRPLALRLLSEGKPYPATSA